MDSWIYAGVSDKYDVLLYVCRLLSAAGLKVLLVDGTERQVYRYAIGQSDKSMPITEYCGFDVACGFFSAESLQQYLKEHEQDPGNEDGPYDIVVYDLEKLTFCTEEDWRNAKGIYWVSSFDRFALERSAEWFRLMFSKYPSLEGIKAGMIFVRLVDSFIKEPYINSFMDSLPVKWEGPALKVLWKERNYGLQLENEHNRTLQIKPLSRNYKKAIKALTDKMSGQEPVRTRSLLRGNSRRRVWVNT